MSTQARKLGCGVAAFAFWITMTLPTLRAAEPEDATALELTTTSALVGRFKGVSRKRLERGTYPKGELKGSNEGWVRLNFMVDPQGHPYEISVEDSLGGEPFERNAIKAISKSTFNPATLNGQPIHSSGRIKFRFSIEDLAKAARKEFVDQYQGLMAQIEKGERAAAEASLAQLEARNLYEDSFRNLALYQFARRWGSMSEQAEFLERALAGEVHDRYLPREVFVQAVGALLALDLKRGYVAESLMLWQIMQRVGSEADVAPLKAVMEKVKQIEASGAPLELRAEFMQSTSWYHYLLRNNFEISVLSGHVSELKLRCQNGLFLYRYEAGARYSLDGHQGSCRLEMIGDPKTVVEISES